MTDQAWRREMATSKPSDRDQAPEPNPDDSPFELPPIEGIPFSKDSEEARSIRAVIEQADSERSAKTRD
jgi:hypothetical protein